MGKAKFEFTKMHGIGNDYVYFDCFRQAPPPSPSRLAVELSDRHCGIGGDGIILIRPDGEADARMQMFNADGSEAEMCGNGIRCVAKFLYDHGICRQPTLRIATGRGTLTLELSVENGKVSAVRVDMGPPVLETRLVPATFEASPAIDQPIEVGGRQFVGTAISMGNPHFVIFVDKLDDELVHRWGPLIETSPCFPQRVNVEFVQVLSRGEVRQRTWERGSGETLACGTGASAVCVAGALTGRTDRRIENHLLGGMLLLEWDADSNHVFKTGPATEVFSGVVEIDVS